MNSPNTIEIPITLGQTVLLDEADLPIVSGHKWQARWNPNSKTYYAIRSVQVDGRKTSVQMHREILGITDRKIIVDHHDHNGLNNRRDNLRPCTRSQNNANSRIRSAKDTSSFKGVYFNKKDKRWRAQISSNGKTIYLGNFISENEAARAYNQSASDLFGEFAFLNPI